MKRKSISIIGVCLVGGYLLAPRPAYALFGEDVPFLIQLITQGAIQHGLQLSQLGISEKTVSEIQKGTQIATQAAQFIPLPASVKRALGYATVGSLALGVYSTGTDAIAWQIGEASINTAGEVIRGGIQSDTMTTEAAAALAQLEIAAAKEKREEDQADGDLMNSMDLQMKYETAPETNITPSTDWVPVG